MFLDPAFALDGVPGQLSTQRYEYIEAATPEEMSRRFVALIDTIRAENAVRVGQQLAPLNVYDMDIAGGGDGHTFVVKLLVSDWNPAETEFTARWESGVLQEIEATFWLAATEQDLRIAANAAIAAFVANAEVSIVNTGMAGAAKGTRFMGFLAGLTERA